MKTLKITLFLFCTFLILPSIKINGSVYDEEKQQDKDLQRMYSIILDNNTISNQIETQKNENTSLVGTSHNSCCCINPCSQEYADRYGYNVDVTSSDDTDDACLCCCFYPAYETCCSK